MLKRSSARYVVTLYLVDTVLTLLALLAARWLRQILPFGKPLVAEGGELPWPVFLLALVIWSFSLTALGVYDPQRLVHLVDEVQALVAAIVVATLIFAGALYFTYRGLSRLLYVYFVFLDIGLCLMARLLVRHLLTRRQHVSRRSVLILGAGDTGQSIVRALWPCRWMGIDVVGYLDGDPAKTGQSIESRPVLGTLDQAKEIVGRYSIQEVIIALPLEQQHDASNLIAELQELSVNIKAVPDYSDLVFLRATLEQLGDVVLIGLKEPVIGTVDRLIKRIFDVLLACVLLILLAPLLGLIALLVAQSSRGPVLYRSKRAGEGGGIFEMYKFRTMYDKAEQSEDLLISKTRDGGLVFDKREDDPRITQIGRFLRRYSLDELPQLINVLLGEMSLVGPRPELPTLVERYEPWQRKRFSVPQGMTGWWQISGRGDKPKYLHIEDDLYYIQNYSLLLDLRIIWRTIGVVINGQGAF